MRRSQLHLRLVRRGRAVLRTARTGHSCSAAERAAAARAGAPDVALDEAKHRARQRMADARFTEALDDLWSAYDARLREDHEALELLGRLEFANGNYEAAYRLLRAAAADPATRSAALTTSSDVAWVQRDYRASAAYARGVLELHPGDPVALGRLHRAETAPSIYRAPENPRHRVLSHVAFFAADQGNFGDMALPPAVRAAFERSAGPLDWSSVHAHHAFDDELLEQVNASSGLVIGGGGLILPDTAPNGSSGWQWNVSAEAVRRIRVPIALHAVGFNLFRGQEIVHPRFRENITMLTDRAEVLGLRNRGSVERVCEFLPSDLHVKVRLSPCPTTVLSRLIELPQRDRAAVPRVLLNMAFDRADRRFGGDYPVFLARMAAVTRTMRGKGWDVRYAAHLPADEQFVNDLARDHGLELGTERLYAMAVDDAYGVYQRAALVIGMRGHATMIPFGLGVPVIGLVSHDKMWFFLDDVGRREWGIEVADEDLHSRLVELTTDMIEHGERYRADISSLQEGLLETVDARVLDLLDAPQRRSTPPGRR